MKAEIGLFRKSLRERNFQIGETFLSSHLSTRREVENWVRTSGDVGSYTETFRELLDGKKFSDIVQEGKDGGRKTLVMDLMGYGHVLRDLPVSGGLAVALSDPRNRHTTYEDSLRNISLKTGDVLLGGTWKKIRDWLGDQDVEDKRFNLILFRPIRGIENITNNIDVNFALLRNLWQILNVDNGMIFAQANIPIGNRDKLHAWVNAINKSYPGLAKLIDSNGMPFYDLGPKLLLVKTPNSPHRLPTLQELQKVA